MIPDLVMGSVSWSSIWPDGIVKLSTYLPWAIVRLIANLKKMISSWGIFMRFWHVYMRMSMGITLYDAVVYVLNSGKF